MSPDRDRGLARERTELAWERTGVSLIATGIAIARGIPLRDGVPERPVLGAVVVALGLLSWAVTVRQGRRRTKAITAGAAAPTVDDLWPVAASTAVVALGSLVVIALR